MIDRETVEKILDTVDIVDVVSDFVHLRRRGANYIGLCPFHNEKTPSFSVSPSKGICKCFSCGKGGSAVNFIMEHEQLSYYEALKYLAKKYNIEIKERELTDKEKQAQSERENLLLINEFALSHFENNLFNTEEGQNIGLSYFYERGFNDAIIKKFHLGYSIDSRTELYDAIRRHGFNPQFAVETGLCISNEHGIYDRFKGRVMFPVFNIAGKVIAFGGRTLKKDVAKYVNSPESIIYKKSKELYGLFQAKQAIVKKGKCFLVEGYTDVLSMHQSGIENVVASSGTSLTEGQIRMIHRFTENVTILYDGDAAGIKASLRGIDLLLTEGLNIKVLLLPDGDDPDSFAKKHNATEFQEYIDTHETDFIRFKTKILLEGLDNDPIKRAAAISDIIKSIAAIPSDITRAVYIKECSVSFGMDEKLLVNEVFKVQESKVHSLKVANERESRAQKAETDLKVQIKENVHSEPVKAQSTSRHEAELRPFEKEVIRYIARFGMSDCWSASDESGNNIRLTVIEYIYAEISGDDLKFQTPAYNKIYAKSLELLPEFKADLKRELETLQSARDELWQKGVQEIRMNLTENTDIAHEEETLYTYVRDEIEHRLQTFKCDYLAKRLCSDADDEIRITSNSLVYDKYQLSKVHTKYVKLETEYERLQELIPKAIYSWKDALVSCQIKDLQDQIKKIDKHSGAMFSLIARQNQLIGLRRQLARLIGDRVIIP